MVKHVVNHMARGKTLGPDNILIDTIIEGTNIINKEIIHSLPKEAKSSTTMERSKYENPTQKGT